MSLLFSNNNTYKPRFKLEVIDENLSVDDYMFDLRLITENMYNDIMQENISIRHFGNIYDNSEIMMESLSTVKEKMANFFKFLWDKISKLWKKIKQLYHKLTMSTTEYIATYKEDILDEDFEEFYYDGYQFTFDANIPSLNPVNTLINTYNGRLEKDLESIKKNEFDFNQFRKDILGDDVMNKMRGDILGTRPIEKEDFEDRCKVIYRNGKRDSEQILVNKEKATEILNTYKGIQEQEKKITVQFSNLDSALKQLSKYFESGKTVEYVGDEKKIHVNKVNIQNDKFSKDSDTISINYTSNVLERINRYYTILFQYAKEVCNSTSSAIMTKANALKDCLKQYDKILKQILNGEDTEAEREENKEGEK